MLKNSSKCGLCMHTTDEETGEALDKTKIQMLKIVSPTLDHLSVTNSVMCKSCSGTLQQSFDFKVACLTNEDYLNVLYLANKTKLLLTEIVTKHDDKAPKQGYKDESVCRLCFRYFKTDLFTSLNQIHDDIFLKDMIEKCLPEINLNSTKDPAICYECMQSLQDQFNFLCTCLDSIYKLDDFVEFVSCNIKNDVDVPDLVEVVVKLESDSESIVKKEKDIEYKNDLDFDIGNEFECAGVKIEDTEKHTEKVPESTRNFRRLFEIDDASDLNDLYICYHCHHRTTHKSYLIEHLKIHRDILQFKCDKCDFVSKWKSSLYHHEWLHNEDERPVYQCSYCIYKTTHRKHLMRHNTRHKKPEDKVVYKCQYCRFKTNNINYFKAHNKTKHDVESVIEKTVAIEKSLRCDSCDFVAKKRPFLTKHRKAHKNKVCEFCGFRARMQWHLQNHMLKHRQEDEVTVFQCATCDFKTRYKNSLKSHLLRHKLPKKLQKKKLVPSVEISMYSKLKSLHPSSQGDSLISLCYL
ncbi:hypothetical protein NQ315_015271 [Exocentrus adspersus]|uniref:C2H2-type domain-containing protein n=1 Tax=Exocentrus adspersus TaxID=1586481 RepID=A0AAV8VAW3_9CUCU|nr:hypothetical protein NQ315_015271 [Exocentrus adspersus]